MVGKMEDWMKNGVKKNRLLQLINEFGGMNVLSESLGVHYSNISKWLRTDMKIPLRHAIKIEQLTRGKFKANEFRSDLLGEQHLTLKKQKKQC